jgi:hypothetical protein
MTPDALHHGLRFVRLRRGLVADDKGALPPLPPGDQPQLEVPDGGVDGLEKVAVLSALSTEEVA